MELYKVLHELLVKEGFGVAIRTKDSEPCGLWIEKDSYNQLKEDVPPVISVIIENVGINIRHRRYGPPKKRFELADPKSIDNFVAYLKQKETWEVIPEKEDEDW